MRVVRASCITVLALLCIRQSGFAGESPKPEEILSRHLDSIGTAAARSAVKNRVVQGTATYKVVLGSSGGGGQSEGKAGFVTEGHKMRFLVRFPQTDYRGENFVYDGNAIGIAFATSSKSRSPFGGFVSAQDVIVRDGLLGGVLSTSWPLLNLGERDAKLIVDGVKKIDGRPAYQVRYVPHKHTEVQIVLYFDQETFRHVKTEYSTSVANNVGADVTLSSKLLPERSTLEETFSDFQTADGITLPQHWTLHFTKELPDGTTTISAWDLKTNEIMSNQGLDPRNFEVK